MRSAGVQARTALFGVMLGLGAPASASGQGQNNVRPAANTGLRVFTPPPGLAPNYRIELSSDWNRPEVIQRCATRGGENLVGLLTWTGASYVGMLRRETALIECGVHGPDACVVQVIGSGDVQASAELTDMNGVPALQMRWSPARGTTVAVTGNCTERYRHALAQLYRTAIHLVVIPVPLAGDAPIETALADQPWKVKVSP